MTFIMRVGSTSCVPGVSVGSGRRAGWKPCIWAWPSVGCSGAATSACPPACPSAPPPSALASPRSMAAFTSRSTMRPAGPEPSIFERSRSFSRASRRTIGEARNCPLPPAPLPEGAAACCAPPSSVPSSVSVAVAWARVPESSASSSRVTLSVSISAMASPSETSSPSLLSHLRRVPSSIASPILGIMTSGTLFLLHVQRPTGRVRYLLLAGESRKFQIARVGRWHLGPAHPLYGSVEVIEGPFLDDRRPLPSPPKPPPLLLHRHSPMRLLDRLDYRVLVEGSYRPHVYDLGAHAVLFLQRVGRPQAQVDLPTVGDERNVRTLTGPAGLAEGDSVISFFDLSFGTVERAGLEEDYGVRVPYGGDHHALHVVGRDG